MAMHKFPFLAMGCISVVQVPIEVGSKLTVSRVLRWLTRLDRQLVPPGIPARRVLPDIRRKGGLLLGKEGLLEVLVITTDSRVSQQWPWTSRREA